jgi:hypothetical protein
MLIEAKRPFWNNYLIRIFVCSNRTRLKPNLLVQCANVSDQCVVEVNLRPKVSRPLCLGVRGPSGTFNQFFFLLEIPFRHLHVCYFVAPSLTRRRVCNLLFNCFWVLPEQSLLGRSPAELTAIFYCLIWDSPNLEGQVSVFISPTNRVAQLYPRAMFPLCRLLRLAETTLEVF